MNRPQGFLIGVFFFQHAVMVLLSAGRRTAHRSNGWEFELVLNALRAGRAGSTGPTRTSDGAQYMVAVGPEPDAKGGAPAGAPAPATSAADRRGSIKADKDAAEKRAQLEARKRAMTTRQKIYASLDDPDFSGFAKFWSIGMMVVILFSTVCFVLESEVPRAAAPAARGSRATRRSRRRRGRTCPASAAACAAAGRTRGSR